MDIQVNGDWRSVPDGVSVAELMAELGTAHRGVAAALDGEVVRRAEWAGVLVPPGARVEIVTAVQGG